MTCIYCEEAKEKRECCQSTKDVGYGAFQCTRFAGHEGIHVACGDKTHRIEEWQDNKLTEEEEVRP